MRILLTLLPIVFLGCRNHLTVIEGVYSTDHESSNILVDGESMEWNVTGNIRDLREKTFTPTEDGKMEYGFSRVRLRGSIGGPDRFYPRSFEVHDVLDVKRLEVHEEQGSSLVRKIEEKSTIISLVAWDASDGKTLDRLIMESGGDSGFSFGFYRNVPYILKQRFPDVLPSGKKNYFSAITIRKEN